MNAADIANLDRLIARAQPDSLASARFSSFTTKVGLWRCVEIGRPPDPDSHSQTWLHGHCSAEQALAYLRAASAPRL